MEGGVPDPAWQLPAWECEVLAPRRHEVALVIPVINEGERIRAQLRGIQALAPAVDVIIADGGSQDGSLDRTFLAQVGVNTLLTKTGPGRLSAQLRMAYAYACGRRYAGIITMDGNNKDGPEAIPRFIAALEAGHALVQGSRYIPGGRAENTPRDRWFAGRCIHAPLVSLATGQRFTDTTNGFRAYATAALLDPRVAPFRDVFDRYNLLFYLSVRLPRLGYRATEVPVSRCYPRNSRTPTKIAGMRGRAQIMAELMGAVLGRYDPKA